mmetsp:Transcript_88348/g.156671  ORF Transcript_88348/g.156671 Transcript_88348/m.156671 type:complete len:99 (+) Transcript_88348:188-484(+)
MVDADLAVNVSFVSVLPGLAGHQNHRVCQWTLEVPTCFLTRATLGDIVSLSREALRELPYFWSHLLTQSVPKELAQSWCPSSESQALRMSQDGMRQDI